jgi:NADH-quinone oxidoreductase subunit M
MTGILSLITFAPLVGVAAAARPAALPADKAKTRNLAKWIAFWHHAGGVRPVGGAAPPVRPANPGFQFVEDVAWFAGLHYRMGVDGISCCSWC